MKQFPLFVDAGGRHVAAVASVPEGDVQGVVISLAGTGRHNLIGSTLCTHLSQRVVEHGLASVRLDYAGVGDSPGLVPHWSLSDVTAAAQEAGAVLSAVMRAAGAERFVAVGTCYGSRVALTLVSNPSCVGAICLAPPVLEHGGLSRLSRRVGERTVLSYLRSNTALRRLTGPLRRAVRANRPAQRVLGAFEHLERVRIAFLYGKDPQEDHYSARAREILDTSIAGLPSTQRERFQLLMLPWGPLSTFDVLSPADQDAVLDVILPLIRAAFDDAARASAAASIAA